MLNKENNLASYVYFSTEIEILIHCLLPLFSRESLGNLRMLSFYGQEKIGGNLVRKLPCVLLSNYSMKVTLVEKTQIKFMHKP